jgi:hypothetical protein
MPLRSRSGVAPGRRGSPWLGRILVVVLGLNVALAWMMVQASLVFAHAVWLAAAGQVLAGAEPRRIASQVAGLRLVQAAVWLTTAGLFLAWVHRVHRAPGIPGVPGLRTARDAVRAFLVPGANLVRVPRVVVALWQASAGQETPRAVTTWVAWWWALCLAAVALDLAAVPSGRWALGRLGLAGGLPLLVLGECVRIAAAVLTIVVVARIERHRREGSEADA